VLREQPTIWTTTPPFTSLSRPPQVAMSFREATDSILLPYWRTGRMPCQVIRTGPTSCVTLTGLIRSKAPKPLARPKRDPAEKRSDHELITADSEKTPNAGRTATGSHLSTSAQDHAGFGFVFERVPANPVPTRFCAPGRREIRTAVGFAKFAVRRSTSGSTEGPAGVNVLWLRAVASGSSVLIKA
jgi:hypothetical protein